jgi:uncharacterized protein HemX
VSKKVAEMRKDLNLPAPPAPNQEKASGSRRGAYVALLGVALVIAAGVVLMSRKRKKA